MTPNLAREIAVELISGAILEVILLSTLVFAPMISTLVGIRIELIQILSLVLIFVVGLAILRIVYVRKKINSGLMFVKVRAKPNHIAKQGTITHFGAIWKVLIGSRYRGDFVDGKHYAWVSGPFCPTCVVKLMPKALKKWLGLSYQHIWRCPQCERKYPRPKQYLFQESEAVEKIADAQI